MSRPSKFLIYNTPGIGLIKTKIVQNGDFKIDIDVSDKEIVYLFVLDSLDRKIFHQYFFLTQGNKLSISESLDKSIGITGVGAENNQLGGIPTFYNFGEMRQDSLPHRTYAVIENFHKRDKKIIDSLIINQKPSNEFIDAWNYHLKYVRLASFYEKYSSLKTSKGAELERNQSSWVNILTALQNEIPISDDKALIAPSYHAYLQTFLKMRHDDLVNDFKYKPYDFYREWFEGDSLKGKSIMQKDMYNQLKQKLIERYFNGKVKEQMYALLFDLMIQGQNFSNVKSIFNDFNKQFPNSQFISYFEKPIKDVISRLDKPISTKAVFLDEKSIAKWDNILSHFKGKTVLIDMWGTWCRPCREELNTHSAALKKHFKNKGLTFLYVANYDNDREKWKQVVALYKLEGNHILASEDLTIDIMRKVKGVGYPTYAIIDKYGKVELSKAGYPMDREVLITQLEEALKR